MKRTAAERNIRGEERGCQDLLRLCKLTTAALLRVAFCISAQILYCLSFSQDAEEAASEIPEQGPSDEAEATKDPRSPPGESKAPSQG